MSTRSPLAALVHGVAHVTGWSRRQALREGAMRVLMLHGVGTGGLPMASLRRLLTWVTRHAEPVSLEEVGRRLAEPDRITGREIALTFDDGLLNNAQLAAPALLAAEVPATFFVCPDLIVEGRWLWNHEARARLRRLDEAARVAWAAGLGLPAEAGRDIEVAIDRLKALGLAARTYAEEALRHATPGFAPTADEHAAHDMMSVDDLRKLAQAGIDIGSHTRTHPILPTLEPAQIEAELAGARSELERLLDRPVPRFCYPNGGEDGRVREVVRRHHDLAVTTEAGVIQPGEDRIGLPRIGAVDSLAETTWRMARP
ncbi:MAG: polysaccharide deacetylase family protein [Planctomycetes bacterium]|nr:polysaccharide deacetylase family protein [Planctomycetota bacterium]